MFRALEMLSKEGKLAFITPNAWLGINAGRKIRDYLLNHYLLSAIWKFDSQIFETARVETVVVFLDKFKKNTDIQVNIVNDQGELKNKHNISNVFCKNSKDQTIPLLWNKEAEDIVNTIEKKSFTLGGVTSHFTSSIAMQVYAKGKGTPIQTETMVKSHCYHHNHFEVDKNLVPYLEGRDVGRYQLKQHSCFLEYGPWLAEYQDITLYSRPRIVVREVCGKYPFLIQANYLDSTLTYNRSILHIHHKNNCELELLALLAYLNSKIISWYLLLKGKKTQRKLFPKIVGDDLKNLPIPLFSEEEKKALSEMALKQIGAYKVQNDSIIDQIISKALKINCHALPELT